MKCINYGEQTFFSSVHVSIKNESQPYREHMFSNLPHFQVYILVYSQPILENEIQYIHIFSVLSYFSGK